MNQTVELGNQDEPQTFSGTSRSIELSEGRSVKVGYVEEGCRILVFINNQGTETKLALTADAVAALLVLLAAPPPTLTWEAVGTVILK